MIVRKRSPNYPVIGLSEAFSLVAKLYKAEKNHAVDREVAAKSMGYAGLTGRSMGILSTLRQYGLIDTQDEGQIRVSSLTLRYLFPESEQEKTDAVIQAALSPTVFSGVYEKFGSNLPSDATLIAHLIRQGFFENTGILVVKVLRETFALVDLSKAVSKSDEIAVSPIETTVDTARMENPATKDRKAERLGDEQCDEGAKVVTHSPSDIRKDVFTIEEGEITVFWPKDLSLESYQEIEDWVEILLRKMKRAASA